MSTIATRSDIDDALVASCAAVIDVTKAAPPDSFVLHAPLELLARALLLRRLPDESRPAAHDRLRSLTATYDNTGPAADPQPDPTAIDDDTVVRSLAAAGHAPILRSLRPR